MTVRVSAQVASQLRTLPEAAEYLHTPIDTLRYWRQHKIGPKSIKIGRRVMYRQSDLDAYIERQTSSGSVV